LKRQSAKLQPQHLERTFAFGSSASKAHASFAFFGIQNANREREYCLHKGEIEMALAAEKKLEHIGETAGCQDHDHDLVHELSKRLDAVWRYDQYIANADKQPNIKKMWQDVKSQEQVNIKKIKSLIKEEIEKNCF
jgi:tRNA U34 5-carboxymethylaminomethyl modifying enzyme MnmG/GidA